MEDLKNNQLEFTLRYTGDKPDQAFKLARVALTFKGFKFENMNEPVEYLDDNGEYTTTFIGTNQFIPETREQPKEEQPISIMNNARLAESPEGQEEIDA